MPARIGQPRNDLGDAVGFDQPPLAFGGAAAMAAHGRDDERSEPQLLEKLDDRPHDDVDIGDPPASRGNRPRSGRGGPGRRTRAGQARRGPRRERRPPAAPGRSGGRGKPAAMGYRSSQLPMVYRKWPVCTTDPVCATMHVPACSGGLDASNSGNYAPLRPAARNLRECGVAIATLTHGSADPPRRCRGFATPCRQSVAICRSVQS